MSIAQVQAVVSTVVIAFFTWSGLVLAVSLLLPGHAEHAEKRLSRSPKWCFFVGVLMFLAFMGFGALSGAPNPLGKLIGLIGMLTWATMMVIGAAGIARVMANRMMADSPNMSRFDATLRSALIYSLACVFPLIGWFGFSPIALLTASGAGWAAILGERGERSAVRSQI